MRLEDYSRLLNKYLHRVSRQGASRDLGMDLTQRMASEDGSSRVRRAKRSTACLPQPVARLIRDSSRSYNSAMHRRDKSHLISSKIIATYLFPTAR
jgi:hypothetical protein